MFWSQKTKTQLVKDWTMNQNVFNDETTNSTKQNFSIFSLTSIKEKLQYQNGHINWTNLVYECRNSRKLVLLVVFIALFFDNMLMTTVGKFKVLF